MIYLNYKTFGQGPALIILHGLFGSLDNWVTLGRKMGEHYSVYLLDQRNHGKSPHLSTWDYPTMADDLADFMDQQGIHHASLIGHSMGGKVVMEFANYHAERIDKLVVADMAPITYNPHHTKIIEALNSLSLDRIGSRQEASQLLEKAIPQNSVRQFLLKNLSRENGNGDAYRWKFNLPVITEQYDKVLAGVEVQPAYEGDTLFLYGGQSEYVVPSYKEEILDYFPRAEFRSIPEAGHWLHAQAPDAFLEEVMTFLQS